MSEIQSSLLRNWKYVLEIFISTFKLFTLSRVSWHSVYFLFLSLQNIPCKANYKHVSYYGLSLQNVKARIIPVCLEKFILHNQHHPSRTLTASVIYKCNRMRRISQWDQRLRTKCIFSINTSRRSITLVTLWLMNDETKFVISSRGTYKCRKLIYLFNPSVTNFGFMTLLDAPFFIF